MGTTPLGPFGQTPGSPRCSLPGAVRRAVVHGRRRRAAIAVVANREAGGGADIRSVPLVADKPAGGCAGRRRRGRLSTLRRGTTSKQGRSERDSATTIASLKAIGDRAEVERWNGFSRHRNLPSTCHRMHFSSRPPKGLKPGRSNDVGMGEGRKPRFTLRQQGWESVGFDPAERAAAAAREQGSEAGGEYYNRGRACRGRRLGGNRRGGILIVLSYVGGRANTRPTRFFARCAPAAWLLSKVSIAMRRRLYPSEVEIVFDINELASSCLRALRRRSGTKTRMRVGETSAQFDTRVVRLAAVKSHSDSCGATEPLDQRLRASRSFPMNARTLPIWPVVEMNSNAVALTAPM